MSEAAAPKKGDTWSAKNFKVFKSSSEGGFISTATPSNDTTTTKQQVFIELFFHLKSPHQFEKSADERHGKNEILLCIQSSQHYRWVKVDCTTSVPKVTDSGICKKLPAGFRKKIVMTQYDFERYLCFDWCWMLTNLKEDDRAPYVVALTGTDIAKKADKKSSKSKLSSVATNADEKEMDEKELVENAQKSVDDLSTDLGIQLILSPEKAQELEVVDEEVDEKAEAAAEGKAE